MNKFEEEDDYDYERNFNHYFKDIQKDYINYYETNTECLLLLILF